MMRIPVLFLCLASVPGMAFAHAGHWAEVAGHDHLLAGAAIGIAIAIGLAGALKGRGERDEADAEASDDALEASEA